MHWIDTFFDEFYTRTYTHLKREWTEKQVDFIIETLEIQKEHAIMDVPCGFGRHCLEFARRGYYITGLEYHPIQIERAKNLMEEEGIDFHIVQGDMRNIPWENKFDRLYNFFTSFGYFDDEGNEETVRQFHKALKPGGMMLLETMNRDWIVKNMDPGRITHNDDGSIYLEESHLNPLTSRLKGVHTLITPNAKIEKRELELRAYSAHELIELFERNRFEIVKVCDQAGKEFTIHANRIVLLARKNQGQLPY